MLLRCRVAMTTRNAHFIAPHFTSREPPQAKKNEHSLETKDYDEAFPYEELQKTMKKGGWKMKLLLRKK